MPQRIALLGSTGSIGCQALDVISKYPDMFSVASLTAWNNADLLAEQALRFRPESVVIGNVDHFPQLREMLKNTGIRILAGKDAFADVVVEPSVDVVLAAIVGYSGLRPTIAAIRAGKKIALANKETMVVAGGIISDLVKKHGSMINPVDSEHSAIFQCLAGESGNAIEKITLTASGGPFLNFTPDQLRRVKPGEALRHPNWEMGHKITIDSASMMNKGLEVIEARWLFDLKPDQIEVTIHPQSVIHSLVHFTDGSVKAQLGMPDMRIPILYALSYPSRFKFDAPRLNLNSIKTLTFAEPDLKKFRNLSLAYDALKKGGNMPCIMNAANEVAVNAFLDGQIGFMQMPDVVEYSMENNFFTEEPDLELLGKSDALARETSRAYIDKLQKKI